MTWRAVTDEPWERFNPQLPRRTRCKQDGRPPEEIFILRCAIWTKKSPAAGRGSIWDCEDL